MLLFSFRYEDDLKFTVADFQAAVVNALLQKRSFVTAEDENAQPEDGDQQDGNSDRDSMAVSAPDSGASTKISRPRCDADTKNA